MKSFGITVFIVAILVMGPGVKAAERAPPSAAVHDLAPTGKLRAAINYGNGVLAQRNPATGELTGVSVTIARAIGARLGVPVELEPFASAGDVFDALEQNKWDVAFLAIEPERAAKIEFSPAYVYIDGTYLVFTSSPYRSVADLDREGARIAVGRGAAYDLYLTRNLRRATLQREPTSPAAIAAFMAQKLDAAAGVRQALVDAARDRPDLRVIEDRYTRIDQAVGVPRGRPAGAALVRGVLEQLKASGQIRAALNATHQDGAIVAP